MSFEDVIAGIMKDVPPRKSDSSDDVYIRRFNPNGRQCQCGEIFVPRAKEDLCGRCIQGLA